MDVKDKSPASLAANSAQDQHVRHRQPTHDHRHQPVQVEEGHPYLRQILGAQDRVLAVEEARGDHDRRVVDPAETRHHADRDEEQDRQQVEAPREEERAKEASQAALRWIPLIVYLLIAGYIAFTVISMWMGYIAQLRSF
jgi:hypothetical protein